MSVNDEKWLPQTVCSLRVCLQDKRFCFAFMRKAALRVENPDSVSMSIQNWVQSSESSAPSLNPLSYVQDDISLSALSGLSVGFKVAEHVGTPYAVALGEKDSDHRIFFPPLS